MSFHGFPGRGGKSKTGFYTFVSYTCASCLSEYKNAIVKRHAKTVRCGECDAVHKIAETERSDTIRKT